MRTNIFRQVPLLDPPGLVAGDEFPLVRMHDHVIHWCLVVVVPVKMRASKIPYLDGPVFASRDKPFALAVERDRCDVRVVAVENDQGCGRRASNLVYVDLLMNRGRE